jgi:hypothetical protein
MEGNFLSKHFTSSGTESGIFCVDAMETKGSAKGEMLGKGGSATAPAVAVQANSTWLVSGATVILNFSRNQCSECDLPLWLAKIWL